MERRNIIISITVVVIVLLIYIFYIKTTNVHTIQSGGKTLPIRDLTDLTITNIKYIKKGKLNVFDIKGRHDSGLDRSYTVLTVGECPCNFKNEFMRKLYRGITPIKCISTNLEKYFNEGSDFIMM